MQVNADRWWRNGPEEDRAQTIPFLGVLAKGDTGVADGNIQQLEIRDAGSQRPQAEQQPG